MKSSFVHQAQLWRQLKRVGLVKYNPLNVLLGETKDDPFTLQWEKTHQFTNQIPPQIPEWASINIPPVRTNRHKRWKTKTVLHCYVRNFFIEPPPDTQRKERQGEWGIWVAMSCYLLHATPFPLPTSPLPTPRICRTACGHVIRISWRETSPPSPPTHSPLQDFSHFWRPQPKARTASI